MDFVENFVDGGDGRAVDGAFGLLAAGGEVGGCVTFLGTGGGPRQLLDAAASCGLAESFEIREWEWEKTYGFLARYNSTICVPPSAFAVSHVSKLSEYPLQWMRYSTTPCSRQVS